MRKNLQPKAASWKHVHQKKSSLRRAKASPVISQMHPEGRLLVLCARLTTSESIRVEIEDLVGGALDWDLLWRLTRTNGVTPLVYRTLSTICPAAVPSSIHDAFRRHLQANALLNTVLAKELVDTAVRRFGGLDVAFNNAGSLGEMAPTPQLSLAGWRNTLDTNLTSEPPPRRIIAGT